MGAVIIGMGGMERGKEWMNRYIDESMKFFMLDFYFILF